MAALHALGMSLPSVAPWLGLLTGLACLVVLGSLCRKRTPHWTQQLPPLLFFASFAPFVLYAISGLEMPLFALLLLLSVRFAEGAAANPRGRSFAWLAVVGFLASLVRPEGVVVFPVTGLLMWWSARGKGVSPPRRWAGVAGAFLVALVVYHAWRVTYFGEYLPTPFLSKGVEAVGPVDTWKINLTSYFINWAYYYPPVGYAHLAVLLAGFAGSRLEREATRRTGNRVALALSVVMGVVYFNFVDWMPGMRYHAVLIGLGLVPATSLWRLIPETVWRNAVASGRARYASLLCAMLLLAAVGVSHFKTVAVKIEETDRLCRIPLANWLRTTQPPGALLAIGDVGMVPYYSGLRTLDVHPQSLTDSYIAKRSFSADYVLTQRPDVIALSVRGVYSARMDPLHFKLYKMDGFRQQYGLVGTVRNQWYDDRTYWIFVRRDNAYAIEALRALPHGMGTQFNTSLQETE
jgi:hypothetical protein